MQQYLDLLRYIQRNGVKKSDRTGVGSLSVFSYKMEFDLMDGFPILTTKQLHLRSIIHELLWFLSGDTNIAYLKKNGVKIWDAWADQKGDLGPIYGAQWRSWKTAAGDTIDQISDVITQIKNNPDSRRLLVSTWNVGELPAMALMPCHVLFQFYVADNRLSCQLYQRSADVFLGLPFNIASYALLTMMIAQVCQLKLGKFIHVIGDAHIYSNHMLQVEEQLLRTPLLLPTMKLNIDVCSIFDFRYTDFELINYQAHPSIPAEIAV